MKKFWDFFSSSRLAIILFFLLALISILGTLIPQYKEEAFYLQKYGSSLGKLILFFQLNQAYHSWWYVSALFIFLLNLTFCSLKRLPFSLKLYRRDPSQMDPEKLPNKRILNLGEKVELLEELLLKKWKFEKIKENFYYRESFRWGHLSVYVVHFSLLLIILGALLGALFGLIGNISIVEGESNHVVFPFRKKDPHFLPFQMRLNKFLVDFYPDGRPKEFLSNVTVIDGNKKMDVLIRVNSPFTYKGYKFYQANYQALPDFKIRISDGLVTQELTLSPGVPIIFNDRFQIGIQRFSEAHNTLFVWIWVIDEEKKRQARGLLIKGVPHFQLPLEEGRFLKIDLLDIERVRFISGLQVKKDSFTWLVYLGFIILSLGIFLVYYCEPKVIWIYLKEEGDGKKIIIGSYAKRNRYLSEEFEKKLLKDFLSE